MKQTPFIQIRKEDLDNIDELDFTKRIILIDEPINTIDDFKKYQLEIEKILLAFSKHKDIRMRPAVVFEKFYKNSSCYYESKIIHKIIKKEDSYDGYVYLCNQACSVTVSKSTEVDKDVTCRNCLHKLEKKK